MHRPQNRPQQVRQHQVRIIGGQWKRTALSVASVEGLRPTPDRVRETLFNWLGQSLDGQVCGDAFAGSGALGFEAASRGASCVYMNEWSPTAMKHLRATQTKLNAAQTELSQLDAIQWMQRLAQRGVQLDGLLLDPPFAADWLSRIEPYVEAILRLNAWVYIESESAITDWLGMTLYRSGRAGQVHYHLFIKS